MAQPTRQGPVGKFKGIALKSFVFFTLLFSLFPGVAHAQPSITIADVPRIAADAIIKTMEQVGGAIQVTLAELSSYLAKKLAHDMAVHLVAGASGQKALFSTEDTKQYFMDLGNDVTGLVVDTMSQELLGFDICSFDPSMSLSLKLGFAQTMSPSGQRRCDFNAIKNRLKQIEQEATTFSDDPQKSFAKRFSAQFEPGNSTLDGYYRGFMGAMETVEENKKAIKDMKDSDVKGQIQPVKDKITGMIKTPKEIVAENAVLNLLTKPAWDERSIKEAALNAASSEVGKIIGLSVKTFAQTLLGEVTKKVFQGMSLPPKANLGSSYASTTSGLVEAREAARSFLTYAPAEVKNFDVLGQYASCSSDTAGQRNPDSCVMDQDFATAVRRGSTVEAMTLQQARREGLLHETWELIGPDDARDKEKNCYQTGYCYSNLVKLRKSRIIPLGLEIAAQIAGRERPGTTLGEVLDSFDCGTNDLPSFCNLVDPNWVLKVPPSRCLKMAPGATLVSEQTPNRHEVCVDQPSCITEDGAGNCVDQAYGYCTKEKNVWRLDGDRCDVQYASCLEVTRADGAKASYLVNTVDSQYCTASNAGCSRYQVNPAPVATGVQTTARGSGSGKEISVQSVTGFSAGSLVKIGEKQSVIQEVGSDSLMLSDTVTWSDGMPVKAVAYANQAMFFNSQVKTCSDTEKGCTDLIELTVSGTRLNLFRNPSFREKNGSDVVGWQGNGFTHAASGSNTADDDGAVILTANGAAVRQTVELQANVPYTVSWSALTAATSRLTISFQKTDGSGAVTYPQNLLPQGSCFAVVNSGIQASFRPTVNDAFERKVCYFASPNEATIATFAFAADGGSVSLDEAQLEEAEGASTFHASYSAQPQHIFMKAPPTYLGCDGSATQNPECANYAKVCSVRDVGCESYTPANGDPIVNGALSSLDLCPAQCVGYDTFKQLGYGDAAVRGAGFEREQFPLYLIPSTAQKCSMADVGCDEFTNVGSAEEGGGTRDYYSSLRTCQVERPGDDTQVYYTWEGSDQNGLQLRTWRLKKSNLAGNAPCVHAEWQGLGATAALKCVDTSADAAAPDCGGREDLISNPDCREFYDNAGVVSYRLFSKTIQSSETCAALRKTVTASGVSAQADCVATRGRYDSTTGECTYFALREQSRKCSAAAIGCRAYRGNAGSNTRLAYTENFENGLGGWSGGTISTESLMASGRSLLVNDLAQTGVAVLKDKVKPGAMYQLTVWAKGQTDQASMNFILRPQHGTVQPDGSMTYTAVQNADILLTSSPVRLSGQWERYTTDPVLVPASSSTGESYDSFILFAQKFGENFYFDNLEIREVSNVISLIKHTWQTPEVCDKTPEGTPSPQEMLGCRMYKDRARQQVAARSFSRLCEAGAVGCRAFMDTQNSSAEHAQIFQARCYIANPNTGTVAVPCNVGGSSVCSVKPGDRFCRYDSVIPQPLQPLGLYIRPDLGVRALDTVLVARDMTRYLIDDPNMRCSEQARGCTEVGKALYSQDQSQMVSTGNISILNLPDSYASGPTASLCTEEALFCDAFAGDGGSMRYFKDPTPKGVGGQNIAGKLCEYRTDVVVQGQQRKGWFRKGTDLPCYEEYLVGGVFEGIWRNADVGKYEGWVGTCPRAQSRCTEFLDPSDKTPDQPLGKPYYVINNDRLKASECPQGASLRDGCVLFDDTMNSTKSSHAEATYAESNSRGGNPVAPVSCFGNGTSSACTSRCKLTFGDAAGDPIGYETTDEVCLSAADCAGSTRSEKRITVRECVPAANNASIGKNDANLLLKVRRDRECGEWMSCTTTSMIYDKAKQEFRPVCNEVRACNAMAGAGEATACASFVETPNQVFTADDYRTRPSSWRDMDYSGYTVPNMVPIDRLSQVNVAGLCVGEKAGEACTKKEDCGTANGTRCVSDPEDPDMRLAHKIGTCSSVSNGSVCTMGRCEKHPNVYCSTTGNQACPIGDTCNETRQYAGRCYDNLCVQLTTNPVYFNDPSYQERFDLTLQKPESLSCRAYPEKDAPVPAAVVASWARNVFKAGSYVQSDPNAVKITETMQWRPSGLKASYQGANVCSLVKSADGMTDRSCECQYLKATYGNKELMRYYPRGLRSRIQPYICSGGTYDGAACDKSIPEAEDPCQKGGGQCTALNRVEQWQGLPGFCLQRDLSVFVNGDDSSPCALWLPVDMLPGSVDIYNQNEEAGFLPPEDDLYYCAESKGRSSPNQDERYPGDPIKNFTRSAYVDMFVDEISSADGKFCQDTDNGCSNFSEADCESGGRSGACKWDNGQCKVVFADISNIMGTLTSAWNDFWAAAQQQNAKCKQGRPDIECAMRPATAVDKPEDSRYFYALHPISGAPLNVQEIEETQYCSVPKCYKSPNADDPHNAEGCYTYSRQDIRSCDFSAYAMEGSCKGTYSDRVCYDSTHKHCVLHSDYCQVKTVNGRTITVVSSADTDYQFVDDNGNPIYYVLEGAPTLKKANCDGSSNYLDSEKTVFLPRLATQEEIVAPVLLLNATVAFAGDGLYKSLSENTAWKFGTDSADRDQDRLSSYERNFGIFGLAPSQRDLHHLCSQYINKTAKDHGKSMSMDNVIQDANGNLLSIVRGVAQRRYSCKEFNTTLAWQACLDKGGTGLVPDVDAVPGILNCDADIYDPGQFTASVVSRLLNALRAASGEVGVSPLKYKSDSSLSDCKVSGAVPDQPTGLFLKSCSEIDQIINGGIPVNMEGDVGAAADLLRSAWQEATSDLKPFKRCQELADKGVCFFDPKPSGFMFTNYQYLPPGIGFLTNGFQGASNTRQTLVMDACREGLIGVQDSFFAPYAVPYCAQPQDQLPSNYNDNNNRSIRKSEIAAIRVTVGGNSDGSRGVPTTFFLLPPNFGVSVWWNGGNKDDDPGVTDPGAALLINDYEAKCGENNLNCPKGAAKNKNSCPELFSSQNACVGLGSEVSPKNASIDSCAAIQANFGYCGRIVQTCESNGAGQCSQNQALNVRNQEYNICSEGYCGGRPKLCSQNTDCDGIGDGTCRTGLCYKDGVPASDVGGGILPCNVDSECSMVSGYCVQDEHFVGTTSGMCVRSNTKGASMPVKVDLLLRETCDVVARVVASSDSSVMQRMVPYTDRLWVEKTNPYVFLLGSGSLEQKMEAFDKTKRGNDPNAPFGAIRMRSADILEAPAIPLYAGAEDPNKAPWTHLKSYGPKENLAVQADRTLPVGGFSFGCEKGGDCTKSIPRNPVTNVSGNALSLEPAVSALSRMFARSYGFYKLENGKYREAYKDGVRGGPQVDIGYGGAWDARNPDRQDSLDGAPQAPKVYPIKPNTCRRPGSAQCEADLANEGYVTVNEVNDGVVRGAGSMKVELKFYFEADKNHMPAKRLVIDWGDRTDAQDLTINYGMYQNHLGLKADGSSACDNSNFGRSSRGCTEPFMSFTHIYTCDDSTFLSGSTDDDDLNRGKPVRKTAPSACRFRPRVMVLDNWGWCNGNCSGPSSSDRRIPDEVGGSSICYSGYVGTRPDGADIMSLQCDVAEPGVREGITTGFNPWAKFRGVIEVKK